MLSHDNTHKRGPQVHITPPPAPTRASTDDLLAMAQRHGEVAGPFAGVAMTDAAVRASSQRERASLRATWLRGEGEIWPVAWRTLGVLRLLERRYLRPDGSVTTLCLVQRADQQARLCLVEEVAEVARCPLSGV